ncbi:MAG: PilZ domain-containing protein [Methylococcaceae bacterium]|nr:PilZ domain-containing protein [Methylococcaceae bacterium]MDZ4154937.1 PilZ domain-containing protein [Methylococcales bacterium]MDP2392436.1 PilZ domain-containing protein [Methylococcaceae bacterium]MDP3019542.1 PilZ domain-containing protein [Methylococcaceae bacterium]MDP3388929.1 PilZ domain-containing protein [Methylococcaceae bacterium]
MSTINGSDNKSNRRVALRVYEQVNLFYQKNSLSPLTETQPVFDTILNDFARSQPADRIKNELLFPFSQSRENDTLNVNISTSGIAFTCQDELKSGDYLMLRILLLSSMTTVMTYCKVVYCKPSNPYESNRYPYSIGAQFVNLSADDSQLINKHVSRRKKQQLIVKGLIVAFSMALITLPDQALALLIETGHNVLEFFWHIINVAIEYFEMNLDHIVEHLFHTNTHETQVIAFYVSSAIELIVALFLVRIASNACVRLSTHQLLYWSRKKASCLYYWSQQSLLDKIKIVGIGSTAIAGYLFFGI